MNDQSKVTADHLRRDAYRHARHRGIGPAGLHWM